jgi:hypothetical protein
MDPEHQRPDRGYRRPGRERSPPRRSGLRQGGRGLRRRPLHAAAFRTARWAHLGGGPRGFRRRGYLRLFIDAGTGEWLGERITEDQQTRFVRYDDWRRVACVRMPFGEHGRGANHADDQDLQAGAIQVNPPLPASLFARPESVRIWRFARFTLVALVGSRGGNQGHDDLSGWVDTEAYPGGLLLNFGKSGGHHPVLTGRPGPRRTRRGSIPICVSLENAGSPLSRG